MTFPTTILGRTWPSARWGLQGLATASGPTRSEQVHHRLARVSADRPGLITDRVAAKICRVGPRMIGLWIETGAWPLPHAVGATTLYFRASDVECWLRTGTWPAGVRFRCRGSANHGRQSNAEFAPLSDDVTRYLHAPSVQLDEGSREG
jgi:hypothetical protein